ncbi:NTP transferase domain-containing protein [Pseudolysinimonas sp.]|uniref:NTP transferase domain-containing protein n=1 Tax=Pseudolysinimonas sp. TaxID=2680009 RepID=UPI0037843FA6
MVRRGGWTIVVPLKPAAAGKSRLGATESVVRALGVSTVRAASRAVGVAAVVVVTADPATAADLDGMPQVRVVRELAPRGLAAAIASALATIPASAPRAVLLGDLPNLVPAELARALAAAARHPRCYVADAAGTGTTLVTARARVSWLSAFGRGSASRHRALGLHRLPVPRRSPLRHDVDTPAQLARSTASATS